jgi:hypothetical protein
MATTRRLICVVVRSRAAGRRRVDCPAPGVNKRGGWGWKEGGSNETNYAG